MKLLAWIGALALIVTSSAGVGYTLCKQQMSAAMAATSMTNDSLRTRLAIGQASVRVDSVQVVETRDRWRIVRDSLVDTLYVSDTVRVLIAAADSAIRTCTDALGRCRETLTLASNGWDAERSNHAQTRALLALQIDATNKAQSRAWRHRTEGALGAIAIGGGLFFLTRKD